MAATPPDAPPTLEYLYFPLYAKGLGPALNLAFSGLSWKGPKELGWSASDWGALKASGEPPFGQLPLLRTGGPAGTISQCIAIVNYVARKAGPKLEGAHEREVALSQMLMSEAEDLFSAWGKVQPTLYAAWETKPGFKELNAYWSETLVAHLAKLEVLCSTEKGFTTNGTTAGELQLFSYLYQMTLVKADCLASAPKVAAWFAALAADERVATVTSGASSFGDFQQYFIAAPELE